MRFTDRLLSALKNLRRHKTRTILTSLGVVVGCMSILIMVSIANGLTEAQQKMIEGMGDITKITVYQNQTYVDGAIMQDSNSITDEKLLEFRAIDHVKTVSPMMYMEDFSVTLTAKNDVYKADYCSVLGVSADLMNPDYITLTEGQFPAQSASASTTDVLVGEDFAYLFADTRRPEGKNRIYPYGDGYGYYGGYMDGGEEVEEPAKAEPYFQPLDESLKMTLTSYSDTSATSKETSFKLRPVGQTEVNYNFSYETSEGMIMDLDSMKNMINQARRAAGLPKKTFVYNNVVIYADSIDNVKSIQNELTSMGYDSYSTQNTIESIQESSRTIQMILGGIGAVSLFVAAIGITNTMIMSLTERTREIGIMKALGCRTRDIQMMFLTEAGAIGFMGGAVGIVFSYLISIAINYFAWQPKGNFMEFLSFIFTAGSGRISVIPLWLAAFGLLFSVTIGLVAGFFPARRSLKVSALEAMKYN